MGSLQRRLEALESQVQPGAALEGSWPLDEQIEEVLDHVRVNKLGRGAYPATGRELALLAGAHASNELQDGVGELELPSGARVKLEDAGDGYLAVSGAVLPSDLPTGIREYVERMEPDAEPHREQWLYEHRHTNKVNRQLARERRANREEEERALREETKRRDRKLLEHNRASVGLPPLSAEELTKWGYKPEDVTPLGGGGAT